MAIITIEVKWNVMKVVHGKVKRSRLEWQAPGLEVYVIGEMKGGLYGQAANLAMNYAESIHIPASWVKRVSRGAMKRVEVERLTSSSGVSLKKKLL